MTVDLTKLAFYSGLNYMKRDYSSGSDDVAVSGTQTIGHNLGFIPFYEVHSEIDDVGIIWNNTKIDQYTGTSLTGFTNDNPTLTTWTTDNTLTISLSNNAGASGTRKIYYLIYKDYGDVT